MNRLVTLLDRRENKVLAGLVLVVLALRLGAWLVLQPEIQSDGLAYFLMSEALAQGLPPVDQYGQHAFFSVGYPLVLAPAFALLGASAYAAMLTNLVLAACSAWLIHRIGRAIGLAPVWRLAAVLAYALWLPGIWSTARLARENLSTPLMLLVVLLALSLLHGRRRGATALGCGLAYGFALLAGGSALPLVAAPAIAILLVWYRREAAPAIPLLALGAGAALVLAPWTMATDRLVGTPTLNTNGGFNLYLGNNPAANGRFVSIVDTPAGPGWEQMREDLGEVGASRQLGAQAKAYILAHPAETARLTVTRLALFWAPNWPSLSDVEGSRALLAMRSVEVLQYLLLLAFALVGASSRRLPRDAALVIAAAVLGFWAIHGVTYNIARYRDPAMPIVILLATLGLRETLALTGRMLREPARVAATN
ncbi:MAG: hypothetical protein GW855_11915 [Erythrobacter sp.]|nr:hypothetical protein [Erythrobacter sp.]NCQ63289.1 hypothetical protein [Alphaproteobacteria bacterium]